MIIWFVFMVFYCFGTRRPTANMGTVAAIAGAGELCMIDVIMFLKMVG